MKPAILFLAIGSILATITLCVAAASPGTAGASAEIEQLKKEIATLRQRIESLEKRLEDRTFVIQRERAMPPTAIDPNSLLRPRSTPRNWRQFEFNGMPYYVIPIDGSACPEARK